MPLFDKTNLVVLLFLRLALILAVCGSITRASEPPGLEVSVFNTAHIPEANLRQAEARAGRIMWRAGIQVTWLDCSVTPALPKASEVPRPESSDACIAIHYPEHVAITILDRPRSATSETFGQAFLNENGSGGYIDIYYGRISSLRSDLLLSPSEILGCVIAHEIGHLQLGPNSHSRTGLMRAHWDAKSLSEAAKGQLLFTPSQSIAMQVTLEKSGRQECATKMPTLSSGLTKSPPATVSLNSLE
jgi:hypothetical protein